MKKQTKHFESHSSNQKFGMGNYYGTGIKAKVGTMRDDSLGMIQASPKKLKTPPKALA